MNMNYEFDTLIHQGINLFKDGGHRALIPTHMPMLSQQFIHLYLV